MPQPVHEGAAGKAAQDGAIGRRVGPEAEIITYRKLDMPDMDELGLRADMRRGRHGNANQDH